MDPVYSSPIYTFEAMTAQGVPCVAVQQPGTDWWYIIELEHLRLAATTGVGYHSPGRLVCGYDHHRLDGGRPCPGFVIGWFNADELLSVYQMLTEE